MPGNMDGGNALLILFLALQILGGHIGMSLILFTIFLSRQIVRHACFVNFCVTWMLFSVSYVLLLYAGQIENPNPPRLLCLVQAAMSYGSAPMASVSSFIFVLHIFLVLRGAVKRRPSNPIGWPKLRLTAMLLTPYIVYLSIFSTVLIYGYNNPQQIQRSTFYCRIEARTLASIPPGVSVVAVIASIVVESMIAVTLYRNWHSFRGGTEKASGLSLHLLIRALVFTLCAITALLTCAALLANFENPAPAIATACLPMAAFVLFGTQADLLRAWRVGRNDTKATESSSNHLVLASPT